MDGLSSAIPWIKVWFGCKVVGLHGFKGDEDIGATLYKTKQISSHLGSYWARPHALWSWPDFQRVVGDVEEGGGQVRGGGGGGSGG